MCSNSPSKPPYLVKSYAVNFTIAWRSGRKKAMSFGAIFASTNKVSSVGTNSTMSIPGWITPPTVLTFSVLMVPVTGETTTVRFTRSSKPTADSTSAESWSCVLLSFSCCSERNFNATSIRLSIDSRMPDLMTGIFNSLDVISRRVSFTWRWSFKSSILGTTPSSARGLVISSSFFA